MAAGSILSYRRTLLRFAGAALAALCVIGLGAADRTGRAFAQAPAEKIVEDTAPPPSESAPIAGEAMPVPEAKPAKPKKHHAVAVAHEAEPTDIEPANAKLRLTEDTWVYSRPAKSSKH